MGDSQKWCYWRCAGVLTDPSTGKLIARVEGFEATRAARTTTRDGGDFLVAPRSYDVARLYAYVDDDKRELEFWSARPGAPRRAVQRPAPYRAAVTLALNNDGSVRFPRGKQRRHREL